MLIPVGTIALGFLFIVGAYVWAACDGHWIVAGLAVTVFVALLVLVA